MVAGSVRHPRVIVQTSVGSFSPLECTVNLSQHQNASTFSAKIALGPGASDAGMWSSESSIDVTIMATNDVNSGGMVQMFTGGVDKVLIDFEHQTVDISGRDKTRDLIDGHTNEKWLNKQPKDIISDLAGRAGLGVKFSGAGGDKAGLKFDQDYNRISEMDSPWNVIVKMAHEIGCIAFVNGNSLVVQPINTSTGGSFNVTYQAPTAQTPAQGSVITLMCSHDLQLAEGVEASVKSWQHKEGKAIEGKAGGGKIVIEQKAANLTQKQAVDRAKSIVEEATSHQRKVDVNTYGDVNINIEMKLVLSGTGTAFDQSYIIRSIRHLWTWSQGYLMTISASNKDDDSGEDF